MQWASMPRKERYFAEVLKNLIRYKFESNFVGSLN